MAGRVCLVTGATSGIGLATAEGLAHTGATTVLVARDSRRGAMARERIARRTGNGDVHVLVADLSSQADLRRLADQLRERYDRLHLLVNNCPVSSDLVRVSLDLAQSAATSHLIWSAPCLRRA